MSDVQIYHQLRKSALFQKSAHHHSQSQAHHYPLDCTGEDEPDIEAADEY
jgi:hypothetical protein